MVIFFFLAAGAGSTQISVRYFEIDDAFRRFASLFEFLLHRAS